MKQQILALLISLGASLQPAHALLSYECLNTKTNDMVSVKEGDVFDIVFNEKTEFSGIEFVTESGPFFKKQTMPLFTVKGKGPVAELVINKAKLFSNNCGRGFCNDLQFPIASRGGASDTLVAKKGSHLTTAQLTIGDQVYTFNKCF